MLTWFVCNNLVNVSVSSLQFSSSRCNRFAYNMIIDQIEFLTQCWFKNICVLNHGIIITICNNWSLYRNTKRRQFNHSPDIQSRTILIATSLDPQVLDSQVFCRLHLTWSRRKPLWDETSCWHCIGGKPFRIETSFIVCICITSLRNWFTNNVKAFSIHVVDSQTLVS